MYVILLGMANKARAPSECPEISLDLNGDGQCNGDHAARPSPALGVESNAGSPRDGMLDLRHHACARSIHLLRSIISKSLCFLSLPGALHKPPMSVLRFASPYEEFPDLHGYD